MNKAERKRKKQHDKRASLFSQNNITGKLKYISLYNYTVHSQYSNQNNEQQKIYKTFFAAKWTQFTQ